MLHSFAKEKGFSVYEVYVDEDLSGMYDDRPAFRKMIKDAQKGKFSVIICKHQSRFTRDMESVEKYIHKHFIEWGIRFISIIDNIDTNVKGSKKARQINGLMNEWQVEDLSDNIRAVFKRKMLDGEFLGSFASYGYKKDPKDRHKLIVDEPAAEVVRKIYELCINGYGSQKIAKYLTDNGILTPSMYKREQGLNFQHPNSKYDGNWSLNTIRRILTNEVYIGTLIQGREKKISYKSRKVVTLPRSQWIVIENNHPPIIDKETFAHVRSLVKERKLLRNIPESSPDNNSPHLLAGKLHCSLCGDIIVRNGKTRDNSTYYLCCSLAKKTSGKKCISNYIRQDIIEEYVAKSVRELIFHALSAENSMEYIESNLSANGLVSEKNRLMKRIDELAEKEKGVKILITKSYAEKLNGLISDEDFFVYKSIFDSEIAVYQNRKQAMIQEAKIIDEKISSMKDISSITQKYKNFTYLSVDIMNTFIEDIKIGEKNRILGEQKLEIVWKF